MKNHGVPLFMLSCIYVHFTNEEAARKNKKTKEQGALKILIST